MGRRDRLDETAIESRLRDLHWDRQGDELVKTVQLPTFPAAIAWVGQVAEVAESMDHHPDIDIRWRTVTLRVATHSAGGLTEMDFELARKVDALWA